MHKTTAILLLIGAVALTSITYADIKLPAIFGDHMVLQQKSSVAVWGWADPGEKVTVKGSWQWFSGKSGKADENGEWKVNLKTPKAGRTVSLKIKGNENEIVLNDILIGEVWICSGQSNMQWTMGKLGTERSKANIEKANAPTIRLFTVKMAISRIPKEDVEGTWQICTPEAVKEFSATGYYFGKNLHEKLNVPIGLVSTNWGGTKAEAWTSRDGLKDFEQFSEALTILENPDEKPESFKMNQHTPTVLYNAMIVPLLPFRIAGAIWYQGESNCYDPIGYRMLFPAMITDWRTQWDQGDFPFYFVQIAPYQYNLKTHSQAVREAQMMTLNAVDNVGMAVTMDIGQEKDIHPRRKHDVGERLARWALAKTYGRKDLVYSGPIYHNKIKITGHKITLFFKHTDDGLVAKNGKLSNFEIAGKDRKFVPAKAEIREHSQTNAKSINLKSIYVGQWIEVWSDEVKEPVAVRYGWSNWVDGSLLNKAGLPASSFRTDDWPLK